MAWSVGVPSCNLKTRNSSNFSISFGEVEFKRNTSLFCQRCTLLILVRYQEMIYQPKWKFSSSDVKGVFQYWSPWGWWNMMKKQARNSRNPRERILPGQFCPGILGLGGNPTTQKLGISSKSYKVPGVPPRETPVKTIHTTLVPFVPQFSSRPWLCTTTLEQGGKGVWGGLGCCCCVCGGCCYCCLWKVGLNSCICIYYIQACTYELEN